MDGSPFCLTSFSKMRSASSAEANTLAQSSFCDEQAEKSQIAGKRSKSFLMFQGWQRSTMDGMSVSHRMGKLRIPIAIAVMPHSSHNGMK